MNGGLMKTSSRFAIVAAASVLATNAYAADLGGNCCADLEERIAELEATTVRKGNRKVSLTLSGQVHQMIMMWDDGHERNTYYGVNNINTSSRFRLVGQAKIDAEWSAGYLIEIEPLSGSNSSNINQSTDDTNNTSTNSTGGFGSNTRHSAWWIDNKRLGRVWVGLTGAATDGIVGIDLSNTVAVANHKVGLLQGGFSIRATNGATVPGRTWSNVLGGNNGLVGLGNETRLNVVKYVSPTIMGFIASAAVGEDDYWDASLKYANEFNGVRVAAGIGYAETTDGNASGNFAGCVTTTASAPNSDKSCNSLEIGASVMHVPTGLFLTGSYGTRTDDNRVKHGNSLGLAGVQKNDTMWDIRAGVQRNFFGIGKSTFYGEYSNFQGGGTSGNTFTNASGDYLVDSNVDVWGLGFVQSIDAAAMDLYVGYRNYSFDGKVSDAYGDVSKIPSTDDFSVIRAGGIIKF